MTGKLGDFSEEEKVHYTEVIKDSIHHDLSQVFGAHSSHRRKYIFFSLGIDMYDNFKKTNGKMWGGKQK